LVDADETATVLTSVFDIGQGIPWPVEFRGRALKNAFSERWVGSETELALDTAARSDLLVAVRGQNAETAPIYAGQSVGLLNRVELAADILQRIESEAELQLRAVARLLHEPRSRD
jgi:nitronate monooxygenase